jgi:serine/threonine-protein kinase RsbW
MFPLFTVSDRSPDGQALIDWLGRNTAERLARHVLPPSARASGRITRLQPYLASLVPRSAPDGSSYGGRLSMGSSTGPGRPDRPDDETGQRPSAATAFPADAPRWRRAFEGDERQLGVMRRWLGSVLPACPARDDAISVATELASNALRHTTSGNGGLFAVEITWHESVVRVGVADGGGPAEPHVIEDPDGEHGRGLLLVRGLSQRTGVAGARHGRHVWADIAWDGPRPAFVAPADLDEAAIRDGEAALARCFAGVPAWFGRSTREWWALAGPGELVTAPTAPALAALLHRQLDAPFRPGPADAVRSRHGPAPRWVR